ncbi:galectin-3-binding protein B-like isoform X2 [Lampris incognitus]|nr:galectin-3-binding protein B-like isoform X2 [Lampris incognitus]
MRLVGGRSPNEGRVEIYFEGAWGTVCDDSWDINEAQVVCRKLNFRGAKSAVASAAYGQGSGRILMDDLNCQGTEKDLSACGFRGWGVSDCKHNEDAGVVCDKEKIPPKRTIQKYDVNYETGLSKQLGMLFDSGRDCDLDINVVVDNGTVETICAHKLILTLDPDVSLPNISQTNLSINVRSDCHKYVSSFVRYIYTRQISIEESSVQCIHEMASDWHLKQLQQQLGDLFNWVLPKDPTFKTQTSLYEYSVRTGDKVLQQNCLCYLAWNCEALIHSPVWKDLPVGTLKALLSRSDLVVPSEAYVMEGLVSWEAARGQAFTSEDLLRYIRFPMITALNLYKLKGLRYQAGKLQGFQFNALPAGQLFGELMSQWKAYTPRIYTESPWSSSFSTEQVSSFLNNGYYIARGNRFQSLSSSFNTPVHNSAYFSLSREMGWTTQVLVRNHECNNIGTTCPAARLSPGNTNLGLSPELQKSISYQNKIVITCNGEYVFHIQDFGENKFMSLMLGNSSQGQPYPCHSGQYSYQTVIRPKYYMTGLNRTKEEEEAFEQYEDFP